jgi:hypothetical protein
MTPTLKATLKALKIPVQMALAAAMILAGALAAPAFAEPILQLDIPHGYYDCDVHINVAPGISFKANTGPNRFDGIRASARGGMSFGIRPFVSASETRGFGRGDLAGFDRPAQFALGFDAEQPARSGLNNTGTSKVGDVDIRPSALAADTATSLRTVVPEAGTTTLLGAGILLLGAAVRRHRRTPNTANQD